MAVLPVDGQAEVFLMVPRPLLSPPATLAKARRLTRSTPPLLLPTLSPSTQSALALQLAESAVLVQPLL